MNEGFHRIERLLGRLLSAGTLASTILLAAGLGLWMIGRAADFGALLLHAGLLVLMATPMVRVVVSVVAYLREREWRFALLAASVLLVLAGTVVVALLEAR